MRRGVIIICIILAVFTESCLMRNGKCIRFIPVRDYVPAMIFSYGDFEELGFKVGISLYKEGSYIVTLHEPPMSLDVFGMMYPISFGKYTKEDNRYLLRDLISNYQMEAILTDGGHLFFEQGLLPFNRKTFNYCGVFADGHSNIDYECGQIMNTSKIGKGKSNSTEHLIIEQGYFTEEGILNLDLQSDGRYEFNLKGIIALSRGQWTQLYDYIVLNDESVNSAFYFRIRDKNTLIGVAIPTTYHRENKSERVFTRE